MIRGTHGVEGESAQMGWAIEYNDIVVGPCGLEGALKNEFFANFGRENHLCFGQALIRAG